MTTNKTVLITGANSGIGKDTARQVALLPETEKVYLGCRNLERAIEAKKDLEESTGRKIFEILIVDVSDIESARSAASSLKEPVDALIMNAGGMGGKTPAGLTKDGVTTIFASNVLGHVALVEELLKQNKLNNVALYASSEAARGVKKMGIKPPNLESSSVEEFKSIFDGSYFKGKMDRMEAYALVKYSATLWMSAMAREYPNIRFVSVSPGGTRSTNAMDDMPFLMKIMFKYVGMGFLMPLVGLAHDLEVGAKRFVDGINQDEFESGKFYASKEPVTVGPVVEQSTIFADLANENYQNNAKQAIYQFLN